MFDEGCMFNFRVLCLYNGIIYSWNCFCYGVGDDGQAYLRLENWYILAGLIIKD